jgi:DNA polymerase epsilon subunit 1
MRHAIEQEEKIPLSTITNFNEVVADIKQKLGLLRDNPQRTEKPVIYHLDVGKEQSLLKEACHMNTKYLVK